MKLATAAAVGVVGGSGTAVSLLAQVEAAGQLDSSDPALYVLGVSLTSLAGALVYIVRQMANGKLVPHDIDKQLTATAAREQQLSRLLEVEQQRSDQYIKLLDRHLTGGR